MNEDRGDDLKSVDIEAPAPRGPRGGVAQGLALTMLRARETIMNQVRPVLRSHGLTDQQWRILRILEESPPLSPTLLSQRTVIMLPSLLRILKALEEAGFIRQRPVGPRGRLMVSLEDKGADLVERIYPEVSQARRSMTRYLTVKEMATLLALLRKLDDS